MLKFISLLGTSKYVPCNYFIKNREELKINDCCYVQKAILDILRQENVIPDKIIIFTTDEAHVSNMGFPLSSFIFLSFKPLEPALAGMIAMFFIFRQPQRRKILF